MKRNSFFLNLKIMTEDLITIDTIIAQAKEAGVDFGTSNPKVHLAYLAKLKLIPAASRRKIAGKLTGCYPTTLVSRLQRIEELKAQGRTYSQIRFSLETEQESPSDFAQVLSPALTQEPLYPTNNSNSSRLPFLPKGTNHTYGVAFLIIGLILGYLVAIVNGPVSSSQRVLGSQTSAIKEVMAAEQTPKASNSALDPTTQEVIRIVNSSENTNDANQIFIISVPKEQKFSNLERTSINQLINNN